MFYCSPDYYPKMFASGKMDLYGELHMLFGVRSLPLC